MGSVEKPLDSGSSVASSKQVSPLKGSGSRNIIPLSRVGSRNTSPSRQKVVKTKPRGFEEETVASFGKLVVAQRDFSWGSTIYDIFESAPLVKNGTGFFRIIVFSSFIQMCHLTDLVLTFWKNSPDIPQCSVYSLSLKTWYKIPFTFLPPWIFWLVGSSGGLVCFSSLRGLMQTWRTLPSMHFNQQRQLIMVVDRSDIVQSYSHKGHLRGPKFMIPKATNGHYIR